MGKLILPDEYQGYPAVTAKEISEMEKRAYNEYGIKPELLMENAGKAVAQETINFLTNSPAHPLTHSPLRVAVFCGRGNNGGDGLVAARHLKEKQTSVKVWIIPTKDRPIKSEVKLNYERAKEAGIEIVEFIGPDFRKIAEELKNFDGIIDALLGTGTSGKPMGDTRQAIRAIFHSTKPTLSVDIPSGLIPDTGYHHGVFVTAAVTVTLGLPKKGLLAPHAQRYVGKLVVANIGLPEELARRKNFVQSNE